MTDPGAGARPGATTGARPPAGHDDALATELSAIEHGRLPVGPGHAVVLIRHLSHPRKSLRRLAAGALGAAVRRGDIPAEVCEALLSGADRHQRWGAAFALARAVRSSPAVVDVAVDMLGDDDGDVRWAAASIVCSAAKQSDALRSALRELVGSSSPLKRKMSLLCLADSGERTSAAYLGALGDPEPLVRIAAMTAIARAGIDDPLSIDAVRRVAETDPEAPVQRAAAAILRRIAGASAPTKEPA